MSLTFGYWVLIPLNMAATALVMCILVYIIWKLKVDSRKRQRRHRRLVDRLDSLHRALDGQTPKR